MTPPDLLLAFLTTVATVFAVAVLFLHKVQVRDLRQQLVEARFRPPQKDSEELTDFLHDVKNHGYGFVRVDPGSVFIRSPRG